jgi:hypothetical protein
MTSTRPRIMSTYLPVFAGGGAAWNDVKLVIAMPNVQPRDL